MSLRIFRYDNRMDVFFRSNTDLLDIEVKSKNVSLLSYRNIELK